LSYGSERTVKGTTESFGISLTVLHRWRKLYTPDGDKSQTTTQQEELTKLKRKIAELEEENDILKKASAYFAKKPEKVSTVVCYQFIEEQTQYAKAKWAEILDVSTSGYYTWIKNRSRREECIQTIRNKVLELSWQEGRGTYGC